MSELDLVISYLEGKKNIDDIKNINKSRLAGYLCKCFSNEKWKIRKRAARLLYKLSKEEIFRALSNDIRINNDDHAFWSLRVAIFLPKEKALKIISEYLKSKNKNIRIYAIDALEKVRSRESILILIECLADEKWSVRKKAADILISYPESVPLLIKTFKNSTEDQSYWIIRIIGHLIPEKNLGVLIKFLSSRNHKHKYFAIMALSTRLPVKAIPSLLRCLKDTSWVIRKQAAEVLEKYDNKALPYLKKVLVGSKSPDLRFWTSALIAKIGGEDAIPFFEELYIKAENDVDMRNYIILSLASIDSEKIFPLLIRAFNDNYWLIRKQAFETAVRLGDKAIAPLVLNLDKALRGDEENVCHWSLKVLLKLKGVALEPIKRFMNSGNKQIKNLIMMLFYEFSDPSTFDILNDALENDDWAIRSMASKALIKIGEPILKKLASYFTRLTPPLSSDRCYWTKKILLESGDKGRQVYENLLMQFNISDLMELSGDKDYEQGIDIEEKSNFRTEQFEITVSREETEEEKALRKNIENIFSDMTSEYEEIKAIALKSILDFKELPQKLIDEIHQKLKILSLFGEPEYRETYAVAFEKFQHKFGASDFTMNPEELKNMEWKNLETKWEKLHYIMLIYHFHPEKYKKEVLDIAQNENNPLIINALLSVFRFYNDSLVSDKISQLLKKNFPEKIKENMVKTLGLIDVPRSVVVLAPLITSKYKYIAIKSLINLGKKNIEKAVNDLTYLNNKKEWDIAFKIIEDIYIPSNTQIILRGICSSDKLIREKSLDLVTSYLCDKFINDFRACENNLDNEMKNNIENIIDNSNKGKLKVSRPRSLHEWQDFINLLEQKKSAEEIECSFKDALESEKVPDSTISEDEILNELEKGKPVEDYEDDELLNIIVENALNYFKNNKLDYKPLEKKFDELIKIEDSIERRKDYIFKLQSEELNESKGNFIEKLQAKMNRKSEIADTEKLLVHLIQKRLEMVETIAKTLINKEGEIKNMPSRLSGFISKYKEIS